MLDLSLPLYRRYIDALAELRGDRATWNRFAFDTTSSEERGTHDGHELERARLACWLDASASDVELVRFLLDAEIAARENDDFQGAGDALYRLSILLLHYGERGNACSRSPKRGTASSRRFTSTVS